MRVIASISLILCLTAPLFAQVVDGSVTRGVSKAEQHSSGPTLTMKESEQFRREVQACWLVNGKVPSVTLGISLDSKGRPVASSVQEVRHAAGSKDAVSQAFAAAKRAVLRCGRDGFSLPVEKYEQWRDIELTFDPERTILK